MTTPPEPLRLDDWPADVRLLRAADVLLERLGELAAERVGDGIATALQTEWTELEDAALDYSAEIGPYCRVCGCTQDRGCEDDCCWVEDDLCSSHQEER